jgi:DNA (cytosine-5)-methyltransferase 1
MNVPLTVGSLFSGIGGIDLGLERAGMQVRWQCEIDLYCQAVLRHHWPDVRLYGDIHDIDGSAERVDLIAGGFPCQPVSLVGKGLAQEDPRWLWPEFARVVGLLRPRYVLVENVPGLTKRGLDLVVTGLAEMGYDAEWQVVSAAAVGAPHLRERIFVVADTARELLDWPRYEWAERWAELADSSRWETEPAVGRVADGVPGRVAQLRALGNAVVPQVAEFVGSLIVASDEQLAESA